MDRKEELEILIRDIKIKIGDTKYYDILLKLSTSLVKYLEEYNSLKNK